MKEVTRKSLRGDTVDSPEGKVAFTLPEGFSRCDKSVWPGVGVGYFIKGHVTKEAWALAVKIFNVEGASRERLLAERIPADAKTYAMLKLKPPAPLTVNGREWQVVADAAGVFVNCYTWADGRFAQVNFATDAPVMGEPWAREFLGSFEFK